MCIVIWAGKKGVDVVMEAQEVAAAERRLSSRRIYEGHILNLRVDDVILEFGRTARREVVEHGAAVGILALTEKGAGSASGFSLRKSPVRAVDRKSVV